MVAAGKGVDGGLWLATVGNNGGNGNGNGNDNSNSNSNCNSNSISNSNGNGNSKRLGAAVALSWQNKGWEV